MCGVFLYFFTFPYDVLGQLWHLIVSISGVSCADPGIFVRGGPGQSVKKRSGNLFFFLVLSLFYSSKMVNFKEIYHFSSFQRGSNIFQGGGVQHFPGGGGGGPIAYSLYKPI